VTEILTLKGKKAPHAYLLNYGDWGYGKFLIDDNSLEAFKNGLDKIESSLSRKLIHNTLSIMTRDAKLSANLFSDIIKNQIYKETNQDIIQEQLAMNLCVILNNYVPGKYQSFEKNEMIQFLLGNFLPRTEVPEIKELIITATIRLSCTEEHIKMVRILIYMYSLNLGWKMAKFHSKLMEKRLCMMILRLPQRTSMLF
jgi:hypothetical protein